MTFAHLRFFRIFWKIFGAQLLYYYHISNEWMIMLYYHNFFNTKKTCEEKLLLLSPSSLSPTTFLPLPAPLPSLSSCTLASSNQKFRGERRMPWGPAKTPNTYNLRPLKSNSNTSSPGNLLSHSRNSYKSTATLQFYNQKCYNSTIILSTWLTTEQI